jgi:hypothetical protein
MSIRLHFKTKRSICVNFQSEIKKNLEHKKAQKTAMLGNDTKIIVYPTLNFFFLTSLPSFFNHPNNFQWTAGNAILLFAYIFSSSF